MDDQRVPKMIVLASMSSTIRSHGPDYAARVLERLRDVYAKKHEKGIISFESYTRKLRINHKMGQIIKAAKEGGDWELMTLRLWMDETY